MSKSATTLALVQVVPWILNVLVILLISKARINLSLLTVPCSFLLAAAPGILLLIRRRSSHLSILVPTLVVSYASGLLTIAWLLRLMGNHWFLVVIVHLLLSPLTAWILDRLLGNVFRTDGERIRAGNFPLPWIIFIGLLLISAPYRAIGLRTEAGQHYRAYFDHDLWVHLAVTQALTQGEIPPNNPYMAEEKLHYYWLYFITPALAHALTGKTAPLLDCLVLANLMTAVLFMVVAYLIWESVYRSRLLAGWLCGLMLACSSYEGIHLWYTKLIGHGLKQVGQYNIDGWSRWLYGAPQIDGLYRGLLFTPQHLTALCLLALLIRSLLRDEPEPKQIHIVQPLLLGLMFGFSGFLGLIATVWYGLVIGLKLVALSPRRLLRWFAITATMVGVFLIGYGVLGFFVLRSGAHLRVGLASHDIVKLLLILALNFGPLAGWSFGGLIVGFRDRQPLALPLFLLGLIGTLSICCVQMDLYVNEFGLRGGFILYLVQVFLVGQLLMHWRCWARRLQVLVGLMLVMTIAPAIPTLVFDFRNAAAIHDSSFTSVIGATEEAVLEWIRTNTPDRAVIQQEPELLSGGERIRGNTLPPFAGRSMAVGTEYYAGQFQVSPTRVKTAIAQVRKLFTTPHVAEAVELWQWLSIDLLLLGPQEHARYGSALDKFRDQQYFYTLYETAQYQLIGLRRNLIAGDEPAECQVRMIEPLKLRPQSEQFKKSPPFINDVRPTTGFVVQPVNHGWIFTESDLREGTCWLQTEREAKFVAFREPTFESFLLMDCFWLSCPEAPLQKVSCTVTGKPVAQFSLPSGWSSWMIPLDSGPEFSQIELTVERLSRPKDLCLAQGYIGATGLLTPTAMLVRSGPTKEGFYGDLFIHGKNASPHQPGYNLIAVNHVTGELLDTAVFDTSADPEADAKLEGWLTQWSDNTIIAGVTVLDSTAYLSKRFQSLLATIGCETFPTSVSPAHAFIGVMGASPGAAAEVTSDSVCFRAVGPNQGDQKIALALADVRIQSGAIPLAK